MTMWLRRIAVALTVLMGVAGMVAQISVGLESDDWMIIPAATALVGVGAMMVLRVPENRISWTILGLAFGLNIMGLAEAIWSDQVYQVLTGLVLFGVLVPGLGVIVPLLFPTGVPPGHRWNWVLPATWFGVVVLFGGLLWESARTSDFTADVTCESVAGCTAVGGLAMVLICVVSSVVSFVVRWRRSSGVEREQLRWLVPPFLALMLGVLAEFGGGQDTLIAVVFLPIGLLLVPVAIGVAITRYRLYEIDRIISRTVAYVVVVVLLGAVYTAGALWLPSLVVGDETPPLFVAASTLAVAALFNPVRHRVLRWVDRHFNRAKYDTELVMDGFGTRLRDEVDVDHIVAGWLDVASDTMQPTAVGVWVRG